MQRARTEINVLKTLSPMDVASNNAFHHHQLPPSEGALSALGSPGHETAGSGAYEDFISFSLLNGIDRNLSSKPGGDIAVFRPVVSCATVVPHDPKLYITI